MARLGINQFHNNNDIDNIKYHVPDHHFDITSSLVSMGTIHYFFIINEHDNNHSVIKQYDINDKLYLKQHNIIFKLDISVATMDIKFGLYVHYINPN